MKKLLIVVLASLLFGCANRLPIAVDSSTTRLELNEQALLLMTVDISRQEKSRFMPIPDFLAVDLVKADGQIESKTIPLDGDGYLYPDDENAIYAFRFQVPAGEVRIKGIFGRAKAFPIAGSFVLPVGMTIHSQKEEVLYLGRVNALLRPRIDHEYRAGAVIPLIDQAVTGLSTGTFDVHVSDMSDEDLRLMRTAYPAIAGLPVASRISPVIDREFLDREWRGEKEQKPAAKP